VPKPTRGALVFPTSLDFLDELNEDIAMTWPGFAVTNQFMAVEV
jgi:hypothetical protein